MLIVPFILAVLVNLLCNFLHQVVSTLMRRRGGRLGIIFFVAVLYTCLFSCIRDARVGTGATERGESRHTSIGLGCICSIHAEYSRFDCR